MDQIWDIKTSGRPFFFLFTPYINIQILCIHTLPTSSLLHPAITSIATN